MKAQECLTSGAPPDREEMRERSQRSKFTWADLCMPHDRWSSQLERSRHWAVIDNECPFTIPVLAAWSAYCNSPTKAYWQLTDLEVEYDRRVSDCKCPIEKSWLDRGISLKRLDLGEVYSGKLQPPLKPLVLIILYRPPTAPASLRSFYGRREEEVCGKQGSGK